MGMARQSTNIAIVLVTKFPGSQVSAQSAGSADAEIAILKKQLRLMEEKLDRLQKQTAANIAAAAKANAKAEDSAKLGVADANGVSPSRLRLHGRRPSSKCRTTGRRFVPRTSRTASR